MSKLKVPSDQFSDEVSSSAENALVQESSVLSDTLYSILDYEEDVAKLTFESFVAEDGKDVHVETEDVFGLLPHELMDLYSDLQEMPPEILADLYSLSEEQANKLTSYADLHLEKFDRDQMIRDTNSYLTEDVPLEDFIMGYLDSLDEIDEFPGAQKFREARWAVVENDFRENSLFTHIMEKVYGESFEIDPTEVSGFLSGLSYETDLVTSSKRPFSAREFPAYRLKGEPNQDELYELARSSVAAELRQI